MNKARHHNTAPPDRLEILAYADGRLEAESVRGAEVAAWIARHPEERSLAESYRAQDRALRRHHAAALREPIPDALQRVIRTPRVAGRGYGFASGAAAAICVIALLIAGVWGLRPSDSRPARDELADFGAQVIQHLDEAPDNATFSDAATGVATDQTAPRLTGFELVSIEPIEFSGASAQAFRYRDTQRLEHQVQLFIGGAPSSVTENMQVGQSMRGAVIYWRQANRFYALSGDLAGVELRKLASSAALEAVDRQPGTPDPAAPQSGVMDTVATFPSLSQPATISASQTSGSAPVAPPATGAITTEQTDTPTLPILPILSSPAPAL